MVKGDIDVTDTQREIINLALRKFEEGVNRAAQNFADVLALSEIPDGAIVGATAHQLIWHAAFISCSWARREGREPDPELWAKAMKWGFDLGVKYTIAEATDVHHTQEAILDRGARGADHAGPSD